MSTPWSSLKSGGQASRGSSLAVPVAGQATSINVPTNVSLGEPNPSQSGSSGATGHGGTDWSVFGQAGQLSAPSGTPSASVSGKSGAAVISPEADSDCSQAPLAITALPSAASVMTTVVMTIRQPIPWLNLLLLCPALSEGACAHPELALVRGCEARPPR